MIAARQESRTRKNTREKGASGEYVQKSEDAEKRWIPMDGDEEAALKEMPAGDAEARDRQAGWTGRGTGGKGMGMGRQARASGS